MDDPLQDLGARLRDEAEAWARMAEGERQVRLRLREAR
jgi:hypothetical protein